MNIVDAIQGSEAWHQHRNGYFNASDAPAMMGESKYKTRAELVKEVATGIAKEIDAATQRRFEDGHKAEALARPIAEELIGESLYPVVGCDTVDGLPLSASFDGLTMLHDVAFEHKTLNDEIRAALYGNSNGHDLPVMYRIQMEQQLLLSGAEKCLFLATKWNLETKELLEKQVAWYYPNMELRKRIIAGWAQFAEDVANYRHVEAKPEAVAAPIEALPALLVQVEGRVVATNMDAFKAKAGEFIASIKTELVDDQDFADADKMVKFLADGEKQLALVKQQAQAQAADIDAVFRAIDDISAKMRDKRLALDRLVKSEKENRKARILNEAKAELTNHLNLLNERLGMEIMPDTALTDGRFAEAIKGLKTLDSMRDKLSAALANAKIEASSLADKIEANKKIIDAVPDEYASLFYDLRTILLKDAEDLKAVVQSRIAEHKAAIEARLAAERERIQKEEAAKVVPVVQAAIETATENKHETESPSIVLDEKAQIEQFLERFVQPARRNNTRAVLMAWEQFKRGESVEAAA